jgi:hypothetical protein
LSPLREATDSPTSLTSSNEADPPSSPGPNTTTSPTNAIAALQATSRYMIGLQCDLSDGVPSRLRSPLNNTSSDGASTTASSFESRVRLRNAATATVLRPNGDNGLRFPSRAQLRDAEVRLRTRTTPVLDPRVHADFVDNTRLYELEFTFTLTDDVPANELFVNMFLDAPPELNRGWRTLRSVAKAAFCATHGDGAFIESGDETPGGRPYISVPLHDFFHEVVPRRQVMEGVGRAGGAQPAPSPSSVGASHSTGGSAHADPAVTGYRAGVEYVARVHSCFGDMEGWRVTNLPGISALDLNRFTTQQPLHISLSVREPAVPSDVGGASPSRVIEASAAELLRFDILHESCRDFPR